MRFKIIYILLLLILSDKITNANLIDTAYSYQPRMFLHSFIPCKEISKNRIKSRMSYNFIDTLGKRVLTNIETINYDRKGRISKIIHFSNKFDDTIPYTICYNWLSDTAIEAKIFYEKNYEKGKKAEKYVKDGQTWKRTIILSRADSGRRYFTRTLIILDNKLEINTISYLDCEGQVYQVICPFKSENETYLNKTDKTDTIIEGGKIKSITNTFKYPKQTINSRVLEDYSFQSQSIFYYDSTDRVKERISTCTINNNSSFWKTIYTYDDNNRIKTIQDIDSIENFKGNREDFYYNNFGQLIRKTIDKNENDSLIDQEYIFNGDTTIYNYRFKKFKYSTQETIVVQWQYKDFKGLELEHLIFVDNKITKFGTIYKYKKRIHL